MPPAPPKPKWTVMVFMGVDTIAGNAPLLDAAEADIAEMKAVGSGGPLNIFVQQHGRDDCRCHIETGTDNWEMVPADERNFHAGQALGHFINWSFTKARHRPEDYSLLVLWGHAYEFAIGHALTREGVIDALDFVELSRLLERLQLIFSASQQQSPAGKSTGSAKLDILGFDACDITTVEMACQLHPFADYLLGSEMGIPLPGWPYDAILRRLRQPVGRLMGPAEFGTFVVRRYCESYTALRTVSLTLLDLARVPELFTLADVLALSLTDAIARDTETFDRIAYLFSQSQTAEGKPYVDVCDLCLNLLRHSGEPLVMEAARAIGDFLIGPRAEVVNGSVDGLGKPFIVEHGRNAAGTARLNGLSIYAPHVVPTYDSDTVRYLYENFMFAQQTNWSGVIHRLAMES